MIHPIFSGLPAILCDTPGCRLRGGSAASALLAGAFALALSVISSANPTFAVNAGTGADLVFYSSAASTFDSEAVPPSGAANIYAALNGRAFLNTVNTNATLACSFTVNDGDLLGLHRNSEWSEVPPVTVPTFPLRWFFRAECP